MIKSFRLRLALLSVLLSGLALAAFGLSTLWLVRNLKIERIDNEVRGIAEREAARPRAADEWPGTERRVAAGLGVRQAADLLFLVQDASETTVFRSSHWPDSLEPSRMAWPVQPRPRAGVGWGLPLIAEAQAQDMPPPRPPRYPQADRRYEDGAYPRGPRPPRDDNDFRREPPPRRDFRPGDRPSQDRMGRPWNMRPAPPQESPRNFGDERQGLRAPDAPPAPVPESAPAPPVAPPVAPPPVSSAMSQTVDGHVWRIGLARSDDLRVAVAVDAHIIESDMKSIRNAYLLAMPFALVLIGAGGWFFSGRALKPLQKLTVTARRINAEGLSQRISNQGEDLEFAELIEVFNRMLGRLERSFRQARRFSADAAHELKTPLAILQGQLERAINKAEDGSPMQVELSAILDEVRHLSTISRKLLLLSQADAGRLSLHLEPFDLSGALTDLVEDTRMLAPQLQITQKIQSGLTIMADSGLLRQVLHNLISNAIKYNVADGWISFATARWGQRVEVTIANASSGIPERERARIFERFYRADPSHSGQVEGVGLGLSVSREIARAHGGDLTLKSSNNGSVEFALLLSASLPSPIQQA